MLTCNTNEPIPDVFYVFVGAGNDTPSKVNRYNLELTKQIVSSGISGLEICPELTKRFIDGDINYWPSENSPSTLHIISSFLANLTSTCELEYALECYRAKYYKYFPSRLAGVYAFGDYESCLAAHEKYPHWILESVRKFRLSDVGKENGLFKVGKFNMEIFSMLSSVNTSFLPVEEQEAFYNAYWSGKGDISMNYVSSNAPKGIEEVHSGVIYEYLIEGILHLI